MSEREPLFHLVAGPIGAGKTTFAMALSERLGAVRFSIDEWMAALFWPDAPAGLDYRWAIERVNRCEAQIAQTALAVASRGVPVVLDLGFSQATQRRKFLDIAEGAGLAAQVHVADAPADERWRRVQARNAEKGQTYRLEVTREMFDFMEGLWEPPA